MIVVPFTRQLKGLGKWTNLRQKGEGVFRTGNLAELLKMRRRCRLCTACKKMQTRTLKINLVVKKLPLSSPFPIGSLKGGKELC